MLDQPDRDLIVTALDETLVVEAAAGTGKTTELVRRIVRIIETGRAARVRDIVAVTFTEKAAGELKLRLREALEEERRRASEEERGTRSEERGTGNEERGTGNEERGAVRQRLDSALASLEEAQISTIHGFCGDLLRERPVEAAVDPLFTVLADAQAARLFDQVFSTWLQEKLADPPEGVRRSLRRPVFAGFGVPRDYDEGPIDRLRRAGFELTGWRDFDGEWSREPFDRERRIDALVDRVREFAGLTARAPGQYDTLFIDTLAARRFAEEIDRTEKVATRDYDRLEAALIELGKNREMQRARKGRTRDYGQGLVRDAVWQAREDLLQEIDRFETEANADLVALLHQELLECVARYQEAKAKAGALDFLDLLVCARDLVRMNAEVRRHFQEKFKYIFVDEFQDTDPLQAEILLLLTANEPDHPIAQSPDGPIDWHQVVPVPGKLFIVGDPKQSIYRFRRADVGIYRRVCEQLLANGAKAVTLSTSFRARPNIQRTVNAAFAPVMTGDERTLQAKHVPLEPFRRDRDEQPSVVALPVPRPYATRNVAMSAIEKSLPDAVAAFVEWLLTKSNWKVAERPRTAVPESNFRPAKARGFKPGEGETLVDIEARHVCILFRRFVKYGDDQTRPYVEALEARNIPHLLVGGRSFHEREEIETMRAALAAIEWPDDELSVFATLRGALFAIGDEELLEYRHSFRHFHPFRLPTEFGDQQSAIDSRQSSIPSPESRVPSPDDGVGRLRPIADALKLLQSLHRHRNRVPVATTIGRLLKATRAHVGFVLRNEGEQALANVLHVAELARQYESEGGLSFRGFIEELRSQADDGRASEAPILEEGSDGVRLMTVHKAKGLEFPVVILADITAKLRSGEASRYLDPDRRVCAVRLGGWSPWDLQHHAVEEEARDEAEGVRVSYVAATRARDLLVVPAVGDGPQEGWWLDPLNGAIFPPLGSRRTQTPAPGCPEFKSKDTVLSRPNDDPASDSTVCPGRHRISRQSTVDNRQFRAPSPESRVPAAHSVVWWDPRALLDYLDAEPSTGVRRPELIVKDVAESVVASGLAAYREWQARLAAARERGRQETVHVRTVREHVKEVGVELACPEPGRGARPALAPRPEPPAPSEVVIIEVARARSRPSGRRFGTLVHAVLATVPLEADRDRVQEIAVLQARVLGAPDDEATAAADIVHAVLAHDLLKRARDASARGACRRETPVTMKMEDGTLVEGVVDLAFQDEGVWTVVDFKTDQELEAEIDLYRRQVRLYADMVAAATAQPARAVLMRI